MKIGVVAPAARLEQATADRVSALAANVLGSRVEIVFHPQCFLSHGHFAGGDADRAAAFLDIANDTSFAALWCARGGYGSGRIAHTVLPGLSEHARAKSYMGYSDNGFLLGALYQRGFTAAHGPLPQDIRRNGGEAAVTRALKWLVDRDRASLEPSIDGAHPTAAFNLTILSKLIGTPYMPDLASHMLMVEDVSEHLYSIDRLMFHITSNDAIRRIAGLRIGRFNDIPENDRPFGQTEEEIARHWCGVSGIPYLGRADIGHDADNKVVPFGR
ncbi:MAG: LD-carboxypeptidase [Alphaproteobacteria bacterium]|nr:LD-carboxypeptidase [Alphaproteobacteria bacterium]MBV9418842.1 LD-carboxypeptidase [Alphaproteobacteria bacterium]MBV9541356.1 LD-carboxypeptidase [Alphaproteobacteria bacterium]MBV9905691.1 LD-carboxypeptidase [Alphaproteobacteria bacterium]